MAKKKTTVSPGTTTDKNIAPQHTYIKHLVECKCILPQFKKMGIIPFHKFVVFSELEEKTALVKASFAQCPNCGAIHRITEIGKSEITNKDNMLSLSTIEDIRMSLPEKMCRLLDRHECELPTWQEVKFILDHQIWGSIIILSKEREGELVLGKFVVILNREIYKLDTFERIETGF